MTHRARLLAIAAIAVASLAGCVKVTSDSTINADDTFSQVAVIATTPAAREQLGSFAQLDLADLKGAIRSSAQYLALAAEYPDQIAVEDYEEGDLSGIELTATDLPLEVFEETFAQFTSQLPFTADATLVRTDDTYVVTVPAGAIGTALDQAGISAGQLELLGTSFDVSISFTFPGLVTSATAGDIDGHSVTLALADLAAGQDITIVAGAQEQTDWKPWLLWGGISLAALVIIGGATALVVQDVRRHRQTALPPPSPTAGTGASGPGVLPQGEPGAQGESASDGVNPSEDNPSGDDPTSR